MYCEYQVKKNLAITRLLMLIKEICNTKREDNKETEGILLQSKSEMEMDLS